MESLNQKCARAIVSLLFFILLLGNADILFSGTTGKIAGSVVDLQTNEPLPGVNVFLEGTAMGAATNANGHYAILNIPPSIYTLRFSMIGYKVTIVKNIKVSIDLTTTINGQIESTVLETGEEITVIAERPLVQLDMTSSLSVVGADEINNLPVQEMNDLLVLQAGIVRDGGNIHIRGGRAGEVAFWVDGVAVTDVFNGGTSVTVENTAVQEMQVISGTFNAEYGQAMSGIVNIITKEGGSVYKGEISSYIGDYLSGDNRFSLLKSVTNVKNESTNTTEAEGQFENPLAKFNPTYNTDFFLSGPLPFLKDRIRFFTSGRYVDEDGYLYGRQWFTPQGLAGDSSLVPMNGYRRLSLQGKLTFQVNPNFKVNYGVFFNDWKTPYSFNHDMRYVPTGTAQTFAHNMTHMLSINHVLSQSTFYELKISRNNQITKSYLYEDPYRAPDYLVRVNADSTKGVMESFILDPDTEEGRKELERVKLNRVGYDYIVDPQKPDGYVHPDWQKSPTSYSFRNIGMDMNHTYRTSRYWVSKFDLTSQVLPSHQLKTGFEFRLHNIDFENFTIRPKTVAGEEVVPFQPDVLPTSTRYHDLYNRTPKEFSAYLQDKLEFKSLIVNLGVRFDYFDPNTVQIADPSDPDIYYPYRNSHRYRGWIDPPDTLTFKELEQYMSQFQQYTPDERRAFMQKQANAKMKVSPRLGISFPITDKGVIHFSYGHFFQIPEFEYLYASPDFKLGASAGRYLFGNPDLNAQLTIMYEIGLQQQLGQTIGMDFSVFYRDVRDWVGTSPMIQAYLPNVQYSQYANKDYSNVYGFTVKLQKCYADHFSANLDYSFQIADGTYSNPNDAFYSLQSNQEPRLNLVPLNWDQRHTATARVVYSLSGWTCSLIGQLWSGRPYTPTFPTGEARGEASFSGLQENMSRKPKFNMVDLAINRRFQIAKAYVDLYMNVYNLFDIQNELNVYSDTGTARYTSTINPAKIPYDPLRIGTIDELIKQSGWYNSPRQIQIGMALGF